MSIPEKAAQDTRFQFFHELPEDSYEAFLSVPLMCRGRVVGVINLQHRQHHVYRRREIRMISAIGFLVGSEIELARLEEANSTLAEQLQTRKVVERARGILQRDLGLNEEQAYLTLQRQSRQKRRPMKEIAEAIILSDEVRGNSPASRGAQSAVSLPFERSHRIGEEHVCCAGLGPSGTALKAGKDGVH